MRDMAQRTCPPPGLCSRLLAACIDARRDLADGLYHLALERLRRVVAEADEAAVKHIEALARAGEQGGHHGS